MVASESADYGVPASSEPDGGLQVVPAYRWETRGTLNGFKDQITASRWLSMLGRIPQRRRPGIRSEAVAARPTVTPALRWLVNGNYLMRNWCRQIRKNEN
ncbi:hypothetical protein F2P81_005413 [Scophthalmus maximus]|uniref:Uncharacterized protein n=1 Tax=Scophthalmus maximus TaxID=52904 RepID=A0A6A4TG89_SCOMX|nr:hypothetical protein F2P81_005413 [Scophthalmus maximus]